VWRKTIASVVVLVVAASCGAADAAAQRLTLDEAYRLAAAGSPELGAARAAARATESREAAAGLPPDPMLQVGVMNLSVPELSADMPTSMAPSIQLMQALPFPGEIGLSRRAASEDTRQARALVEELGWDVRRRVAADYFELYRLDEQLSVMRETVGLLEELRATALSMYSTGMASQSDVLRAEVAVARAEADVRRMDAMRSAAAARLNATLGRAADLPVEAVALPPLPDLLPPTPRLLDLAGESRPALEAARAAVDGADARLELARRRLWPDVTVGLQYGQRAAPGGTQRMGGLMVGLSLPVFAAARQLPLRQEADAMRAMEAARLERERVLVESRVTELVAELERSRALLDLYRGQVLPQARAAAASALAAYRSGAVDFTATIDSRLSASEYEMELHALLAEYGAAVSELEATIGQPLPGAATILAETR